MVLISAHIVIVACTMTHAMMSQMSRTMSQAVEVSMKARVILTTTQCTLSRRTWRLTVMG